MVLLFDVYGVCMQLYELVLAVLGIILFIAAIVFTALKRDGKLLISMYLLSIVMIAFPALSKIVFAEVTLEVQRLECTNQQLSKNPADTSLQARAKEQIEAVKKTGPDSTNVKTVVTIATTNALLGDSVKAAIWADKGLKFHPEDETLKGFREDVLSPRVKVEYDLNKLHQSPADSSTMQQLKEDVSKLQNSTSKNTHLFTTLTKAQLVLGDTAKAALLIDSALAHNPANKEAMDLKRRMISNPRVTNQ
jgi:hypothetical protein